MGGHLVTITSAEEQTFIGQLADQGDADTYSVGGTDEGHEGSWEWITGEPWEYTNWYPGGGVGSHEPNNGLGKGEDYICISKARGWKWVDWYGGYDKYEAEKDRKLVRLRDEKLTELNIVRIKRGTASFFFYLGYLSMIIIRLQ